MKNYHMITYIFVFLIQPIKIYFSLNDLNNFLNQTKIIRCGLIEDSIPNYDGAKLDNTDLVILALDKPAPYMNILI